MSHESYGPRDPNISFRLARLEYLQQPEHVREQTRERAQRCCKEGSAMAAMLAKGLHAPEGSGELKRLEARMCSEKLII